MERWDREPHNPAIYRTLPNLRRGIQHPLPSPWTRLQKVRAETFERSNVACGFCPPPPPVQMSSKVFDEHDADVQMFGDLKEKFEHLAVQATSNDNISDSDSNGLEWTEEEETIMRHKMDWRVVPWVTGLYLLCVRPRPPSLTLKFEIDLPAFSRKAGEGTSGARGLTPVSPLAVP